MLVVELAVSFILGLYVLSQTLRAPRGLRFIGEWGLVCAASWITEQSCILLYGVYAYSNRWSLFLGRVPLLVVLVWPAVIHSARTLASELSRRSPRSLALAASAIVFTDACLIEPVAVRAGLWSWSMPGIFNVPPVVMCGWAFFALMCQISLSRTSAATNVAHRILWVLLLPPLCTHLLILGSWWGALRWVGGPLHPSWATAVAWVASILLLVRILRNRIGESVEKRTLLLRIPGALFFFVLLGLNPAGSGWLIPYAGAFVPPYVGLMVNQYRNRRPSGS